MVEQFKKRTIMRKVFISAVCVLLSSNVFAQGGPGGGRKIAVR